MRAFIFKALVSFLVQATTVALAHDVVTPSPSPQASPGSDTGRIQYVASNNYNIRSQDGVRMCTVPRGTQLVPNAITRDGDYVRVTLNHSGCPKEGWIAVTGLQPIGQSAEVEVDVEGSLALRAEPTGKFQCGIPQGTRMSVIGTVPANHKHRAWVKVALSETVAGCPSTGWVHREYIRPAKNQMTGVTSETVSGEETSAPAQQDQACTNCPAKDRMTEIKQVALGAKSYDEISTWRKHRGLVQIPTRGSMGNIGPCGSFHYNPDVSGGRVVDNYANPTTACVMMSVLQDWRKHYCPDNSEGCRVAWGDISHVTRPYFNSHRSHTEGTCIDIRPLRKGDFQNAPLKYTQRGYDRQMTAALINLMKKKGGTPVLFNDRKAGGKWASGHDNHIHVCFPPSKATRNVCKNFEYDSRICGAQ